MKFLVHFSLAVILASVGGPFARSCSGVQALENPVTAQNPPQTKVQQSAENHTPAQITGHVFRFDDGTPIARATVTITASSEPQRRQSVRTGLDGSYSFTDLVPRRYWISACRNGFICQYYSIEPTITGTMFAVSLTPGQNLENVDIRLGSTCVISGKVIDEDGDPVVGVKVSAFRPSFQPGGMIESIPKKKTTTDDRGEFRLSELAPGNYIVKAGGSENAAGIIEGQTNWNYQPAFYPAAAHMDEAVEVHAAAGLEAQGINIHVNGMGRSTYAITGKVSGTAAGSGRSITDISLIHGDEVVYEREQDFNRTGNEGFVLEGVSPGQYSILVTSYRPRTSTAGNNNQILEFGIGNVTVTNQNANVNIHLGKSGVVRGHVIVEDSPDPGQNDRGDMEIDLDAESGIGAINDPSETKMERNGDFTIENLAPGKYWFSIDGLNDRYFKQITCDDKDYLLRPIEIEVGTTMDCQIILGGDAATIIGQVMNEDKPVPNYTVVAIPDSDTLRKAPYFFVDNRTDSSGNFIYAPVAPGDYLLFAVPRDPKQGYYALDFADRNQGAAVRVTVKAYERKILTLKPTTPQ
jgi:hypothetical protein